MKKLKHKDIECYVREGTTDEKAFNEVVVKNNYLKKNFDIKKGETWLDLGGNIGTFSLVVFSKGGYPICYEPEKSNIEMIKKNFKLMNVKGEIIPKAVIGTKQKKMYLSLGVKKSNFWRNSLVKNWKGNFYEVECINFDHVINEKIDGIKMDIEGSEFDILSIDRDWKNVKKLVLEYHFDMNDSVDFFRKIIDKLSVHFPNVKYSKIPEGIKKYNFFPPCKIVFFSK